MKPLALQRVGSFSSNDDHINNNPGSYSPRPTDRQRPPPSSSSSTLSSSPLQGGEGPAAGGSSSRNGTTNHTQRHDMVAVTQHTRRQRSPSQPMMSLAEHEASAASSSSSSIDASSSSCWTKLTVLESFLAGEIYRRIHHTTTSAETLKPNPSRSIRTLAVSSDGETVVTGDRLGRLFWYQLGSSSTSTSSSNNERGAALLDYKLGKQIYTSVIDPLNNVEVTPAVTKVAFLPRRSPTQYLLATNEKVPKLYKFTDGLYDTPTVQRRAVDQLDLKMIGPLTSAQNETAALKQVHHYAMDHEHVIHSLSVTEDGTQFVTADPHSVRLWCVEHPQTSIEVMNFRVPQEAGAEPEQITFGAVFPNEPNLYFACTTSGYVRVVDMRESLVWTNREPLALRNPSRPEDEGPFHELCAALNSCALSPCGRYVAGRDSMTAVLWDVRMGSHPPSSPSPSSSSSSCCVARWDLHPHLRSQLDTLYQSELLFERFDIQFAAGSRTLLTGSFDNRVCVVDTHSSNHVGGGGVGSNNGSSSSSLLPVKYFVVPLSSRVTGAPCLLQEDPRGGGGGGSAAVSEQGKEGSSIGTTATTSDSGSRITLMSAPHTGRDGETHLYFSNGEALVHCRR